MSLGDRIVGAVGEPVPPTAGGVSWPPVGAGLEPTGCGLPTWLARSSARFFSYTPKATPATASSTAATARKTATPSARERGAPPAGVGGAVGGPPAGGLPAAGGTGPRAAGGGGNGPFAGDGGNGPFA